MSAVEAVGTGTDNGKLVLHDRFYNKDRGGDIAFYETNVKLAL